MSFNGNEGTMVTSTEAIAWTAAFRNSSQFAGVNGIFYGKKKIETLINQAGAVGIRVYPGIDDAGLPVMILVGTDAKENDIMGVNLLERGSPCPPMCGGGGGVTNPLQG